MVDGMRESRSRLTYYFSPLYYVVPNLVCERGKNQYLANLEAKRGGRKNKHQDLQAAYRVPSFMKSARAVIRNVSRM